MPGDAHVAVLGAGAWGTALALSLAERGDSVRLWTWQEEHARELARDRENKRFFPGSRSTDASSRTPSSRSRCRVQSS